MFSLVLTPTMIFKRTVSDLQQLLGAGGIRLFANDALAFFADLADRWLKWDGAEEFLLVLVAHGLRSAVETREDLSSVLMTVGYLAVRADEQCHVLDHTHNRRLGLQAEVDLFLHVVDGHHLSQSRSPAESSR